MMYAGSGHAVQSHGHHPGLEFAVPIGGQLAARSTRTTHHGRAPRAMARAWHAFTADVGGKWRVSWDDATGVPNRIWGSGMPAPGSNADPVMAERFARALLARHIDLLAPGSSAGDFELVSSDTRSGLRIVGFVQRKDGIRVIGGQLSFRFKNDRLFMLSSQALPRVPRVHVPGAPAGGGVPGAPAGGGQDLARKLGHDWIAEDDTAGLTVGAVEGPFVLPLVSQRRILAYRHVLRVTVERRTPAGRWSVYLDASTGERVAREQTLRFAEAELHYNAPVRYPLSDRQDYPASEAQLVLDGKTIMSTVSGSFPIPDGETLPLLARLTGQRVKIDNKNGPEANKNFDVTGGDIAVWNASGDEIIDAQLSSFIHAQRAQKFALTMVENMTFAKSQLRVNVNLDDQCNAFYDGQSINFFLSSQNCANTGRLADVVFHEFGHGFHHHSIQPGVGERDRATGEGVSDYFASTFTDDPAMGRGFFHSGQPLRHIDPDGFEHVWPDHIHPDPHQTGLIIAGALWDMRTLLIGKHGKEAGVALADKLFAQALRSTTDIPSMYPEILAADDDDGNLDNGTPNVCEITNAFARHGLRAITMTSDTPDVEPPKQSDDDAAGHKIQIRVDGLFEQCPDDTIDNVRLEWRLRRNPNQLQKLDMQGGPQDYEAIIPHQDEGEVVLYKVGVELKAGSTMSFPDNRADTMYQFFVGEVVPLYCTDFETDPELDGWTHELAQGEPSEGADDWQWDVPQGTTQNGDPLQAYSGERVLGNDLGHGNFNGLYQGNKTNFALSPVIDTTGYDNIRLQYRRWLNVEDGFFDQATIYANGQPMWTNLASKHEDNAKVHHRDREWRFQDIDLSKAVAVGGGGADGDSVQIKFELATDDGLNFGGWSLDDFCIVAYEGSLPTDPKCGNGEIDPGEQCDDGNLTAEDGCSPYCRLEEDPNDPADDAQPAGPAAGGFIVRSCGCRVVGTPTDKRGGQWLFAIGLLGLGGMWRRQRKRQRQRQRG
jgi:MYXO-CTERM domain-containing protein